MAEAPAPTEGEKQAAAHRARLADVLCARLVAAMELCPGGHKFARWVLSDRAKLLPDRIIYTAHYPERNGWFPTCPNESEALPGSPGWVNEKTGERYFPFRWQHSFDFIADATHAYTPRTAEQLATARGKREDKARAALAADLPLFAGDIEASRFLPAATPAPKRAKQRALPPERAPAEDAPTLPL